MVVSVATPPPVEPVTLSQARNHLRLVASGSPESHPDDDFISRAIAAARQMGENFCNRAFVETTFTWRFDRFKSQSEKLTLPIGAGLSVESISYTDKEGNNQTFADFVFLPSDTGGQIAPTLESAWPDVRGALGDVTITFRAGYAPTDDSPTDYRANVPAAIKNAMLFMVGHMYEHRTTVALGTISSEIPMTFEHLLWPYRIAGL